jgi:hypothetical protein
MAIDWASERATHAGIHGLQSVQEPRAVVVVTIDELAHREVRQITGCEAISDDLAGRPHAFTGGQFAQESGRTVFVPARSRDSGTISHPHSRRTLTAHFPFTRQSPRSNRGSPDCAAVFGVINVPNTATMIDGMAVI